MNTDNNNHEPTTPVDYTQSNPYLMHESNISPPPPPEYYMHQRTGGMWRILIPIVILIFGLVLGVLVYPVANTLYNHSVSPSASPTPFVPFANPASQTQTTTPTIQVQTTPTITPQPKYTPGLELVKTDTDWACFLYDNENSNIVGEIDEPDLESAAKDCSIISDKIHAYTLIPADSGIPSGDVVQCTDTSFHNGFFMVYAPSLTNRVQKWCDAMYAL